MLSSRRFGIARQLGEATAYSHFLMFLNPKFRGPKFKWDDLPELAAKMARGQVELAGSFGRDRKAMEDQAAHTARHTIERCFRESKIKDWLPLRRKPRGR